MTGRVMIIGLGPGPAKWVTPEANTLLAEATDIIGYGPYVARVPPSKAVRHASDNRVEIDRARHALELAADGAQVAVVSGGDPGVFAMAAAVFEAVEVGEESWRELDIVVAPGVTAVLAASARIGAPLGHDFCVISLSDNLKPWSIIEKRLVAAVEGDFVLALYNPASKARPDQIARAFEILRRKAGERVVILAKAVGRPDEEIVYTSLKAVEPADVDMRTLVLIGSSQTRMIAREDKEPWVYSPRRWEA
ncbi:precorrin-3B C(17)-methyltransferase [Labrys miyagiensis]|uniref:Precorrin-3B C(17)-methyltransferase n=1 Tax=Labrys miyagiensis TaxID=346912 RepID=A0ABQ6CJD3_9HYPH|nr:precorrin-3B C(17)-methyltransferase [Labrys miyagiensis]GLS18336.1 precorrin-3B C(17)-methyltransferase [Labrys miyagiensis]